MNTTSKDPARTAVAEVLRRAAGPMTGSLQGDAEAWSSCGLSGDEVAEIIRAAYADLIEKARELCKDELIGGNDHTSRNKRIGKAQVLLALLPLGATLAKDWDEGYKGWVPEMDKDYRPE